MSTVRQRQNDKQVPGNKAIMETVSKALKSEQDWQDKDEFLDVVYWFRQIIGVVLGVIWGVVPLKGFVGILLFLAINVAIIYLYCSSYQRIDEEEVGGLTEILKEGLMTSFSSFLVAWIIFYSALHYE